MRNFITLVLGVIFVPLAAAYYVIRRMMPFTFYEYYLLDAKGKKLSPTLQRKKMQDKLEKGGPVIDHMLKAIDAKMICISSKGGIWAYSFRNNDWSELTPQEYLQMRKS